FLSQRSAPPLPLHSFPTRRSSDLRPLLASPNVEFIGEIADAEKSEFLSGAVALLVPIDWPEPFGLVMIEAMACGTPVIAYNRGRSEEHTSELQSRSDLVCRLLLEK